MKEHSGWKYPPKIVNFKPEEVVFRSEMPFDDTTSYKTQFPKYDVEPNKISPAMKCMCHLMRLLRAKLIIEKHSKGSLYQRELQTAHQKNKLYNINSVKHGQNKY